MAEGTVDSTTVAGFGREWTVFDQSRLDERELAEMFGRYFAAFPWHELPAGARGIDIGCGSGRWARLVADRVGQLVGADASEDAATVARRALDDKPGASVTVAAAGALPIRDAAFDFGYALGVIHHTPEPLVALRDCVRTLAPGAPFLLYVYYALDDRPAWYRGLWRATDLARRAICRLPFPARYWLTQALAVAVYLPCARTARAAERAGVDPRRVERIPLSSYRHRSFYVMRNDALDRFGTRMERRFTRTQVRRLLEDAGLDRVEISDSPPRWCAIGWAPGAGP
jgi:ubiquinone/menaquinone biosynthesis C-methylase UbiE